METFRRFDITLHSANNLLNVRSVFDMKVYAKVSIGGVADTELTTPVDTQGKTNPSWNHKMAYTLNEAAIQNKDIDVSIKLYCKRSLKGEVNLNLKMLFDDHHAKSCDDDEKVLTYEVFGRGSKGEFGTLELSYAFGEALLVEEREADSADFWRKDAFKFAGRIAVKVVRKVALGMIVILFGLDDE